MNSYFSRVYFCEGEMSALLFPVITPIMALLSLSVLGLKFTQNIKYHAVIRRQNKNDHYSAILKQVDAYRYEYYKIVY